MARGQKRPWMRAGRWSSWTSPASLSSLPWSAPFGFAQGRLYAPKGRTPVIRERLSYDHLSAISAITPEGKLYLAVQEQALTGVEVVRFLRHLLRHIPGKLLVVWDGSPIHRGRVVKDYLADGGGRRIHLERLPASAPELNPDEGVWNSLRQGN